MIDSSQPNGYRTTTSANVPLANKGLDRLHAIDRIRASMMILGIVFHASCTYTVIAFRDTWPVHDTTTAYGFDFIAVLLHNFRMPLFFVVSGFFASVLMAKRGPGKMVINRMRRIGLPFIIGLPIVQGLVHVAFVFFNLIESGNQSPLIIALFSVFSLRAWSHMSTLHLWFLYYLMYLCLAGALIERLVALIPQGRPLIKAFFDILLNRYLVPIVWPFLSFLCLWMMGTTAISTDLSFVINIPILMAYTVFFVFGWQLYARYTILVSCKRFAALRMGIGLIILIGKFMLLSVPTVDRAYVVVLLMAADAFACWLMILGIIGLCSRLFSQYSAIGRYLSDASYRIYLIHLPLILLSQACLLHGDIPVALKFFITVVLTFTVSLVSYDVLVRDTFIGAFLNGRKYNRGLPSRVVDSVKR